MGFGASSLGKVYAKGSDVKYLLGFMISGSRFAPSLYFLKAAG